MGRLNDIYRSYGEKMSFFCVYIQEAHPEDGWQVEWNLDEGLIYNQPVTLEERGEIANTCVLRHSVEMPVLLDEMDNEVDRLYAALPERLYVIDREGRVAWKSIMGSGGFDAEAFADAVRLAYRPG